MKYIKALSVVYRKKCICTTEKVNKSVVMPRQLDIFVGPTIILQSMWMVVPENLMMLLLDLL